MARFNKVYTKKLFLPDGKDKDQNNKMESLTATATELNTLRDVVPLADEMNWLDSSVNAQLMAPGSGFMGEGTVTKYAPIKQGDIFTTKIILDITGLHGGGTAGDIIGVAGAANCYYAQLTPAITGTCWYGYSECLETPAGGNLDFDFWAADEGTGAQDAAISSLTNATQLSDAGQQGKPAWKPWTLNVPSDNQYLYLTNGVATDAEYTAGRFIIYMFGI